MTNPNIFSKPGIASTMIFGIGAMLLSMAGTAWAETAGSTTAERCLSVAAIKRTKVIDDQNILFYTRNHKVYNNHLPYACAGLTVANTFKYATSQSQLCNVDIITVLHQISGGYMPGAACGLGLFEPTPDPEKTNQKI